MKGDIGKCKIFVNIILGEIWEFKIGEWFDVEFMVECKEFFGVFVLECVVYLIVGIDF